MKNHYKILIAGVAVLLLGVSTKEAMADRTIVVPVRVQIGSMGTDASVLSDFSVTDTRTMQRRHVTPACQTYGGNCDLVFTVSDTDYVSVGSLEAADTFSHDMKYHGTGIALLPVTQRIVIVMTPIQ